nr:MAG TPA: hypothetical protein [Caudoviricetes sp.]
MKLSKLTKRNTDQSKSMDIMASNVRLNKLERFYIKA